MRFCTNCGAKLADDWKFCAKCGTPAAGNQSTGEAENKLTEGRTFI